MADEESTARTNRKFRFEDGELAALREHFDSEVRHVKDLLDAHKEMDDATHTHEKEARQLAAAEIDRRLEGMNKFRDQILQERGIFVSRELHDKLEETIDGRLKVLENVRSNLEGRLWMIGAFITGVVVIVDVVIAYLRTR